MDWKGREFMKSGFIDPALAQEDASLLGWKNLFMTIWREIFTLVKANLCFLLFCIPIVTMPAALCALHGVCVDVARGRDCKVMRTFLHTIKSQLLQSWAVFLLLGLLEFISAYGAWFYFSHCKGNWLLLLMGVFMSGAAVITYLMISYCYTMLARVDLTLGKVLKNSFLLTFLNLKFSICSGVITIAVIVLCSLFWLRVFPLLLLCAFSLVAYFATYFSLFGLEKYVLTENL